MGAMVFPQGIAPMACSCADARCTVGRGYTPDDVSRCRPDLASCKGAEDQNPSGA